MEEKVMSKEAPTEHILCECVNRGRASQMRKEVLRELKGGAQIEIIRYTCPACGFTKRVVDTHNDKIGVTQAQYNSALNV
jgi:hypothetical protein